MPPRALTVTADTVLKFLADLKRGSYHLDITPEGQPTPVPEGGSYFLAGANIVTVWPRNTKANAA